MLRPIGVSPLPSFAWHPAQWSAQYARAAASTSSVSGLDSTGHELPQEQRQINPQGEPAFEGVRLLDP
ncbi:MAG TPA: hypothetical protein VMU05_11000 [Dongiaceae bacterium]|nr:hypothetical protein [Dongiaceae bacterium]